MVKKWGIMKFFLVISLILLIGVSAVNADDVIFTEDFESGPGIWFGDNGVWQIGTPTAGPDDCHGGVGCAGTVLNGNYPDNTDSRLISPPVDLPGVAGSNGIFLSFWQWFSYSESPLQDGGVVQISVWDEGLVTWSDWEVISENVGYSSPWSRSMVDLTAYAGELIRLGFFHYADSLTQSTGWYIDDISIIAKVPEFTGDFEAGWEDWSGERGVWQVGAPTEGPEECHSGTSCAGTVLDGNYPDNTDSRLISSPVDLSTVTGNEGIYLSFWQWFSYSESPTQDGGVVQISVWDDGAGAWSVWTDISERIGYSSPWSRVMIDLTVYAGERVRVGFFHYADSLTQSTGWYIDDIEIFVKVPEFTGDFEAGWEDWSADRGVWQIGTPTTGPISCHSGAGCAGTVLDGNYPDNTDSRLISSPVNLPDAPCNGVMLLRFWQWFSYSESPTQDGGVVQISVWDDGAGDWSAWTNISNPIGYSSPWSQSIVDLTAYAGDRVRIGFYHYADSLTQSAGWYIDDVEFVGISPEINSITYDLHVPKGDSANIAVVANDPCGGSLEYKWDTLDGGTIVGDGPDVSFIMPVEDRFCPYRVRVAVISDETNIGTTHIFDIYNRCPGDGNEDGVTNILDKVLVRNAFGTACGDLNFDPRADVNCDCVVNILDKVQVRNSFGCSQ